MPISHPTQHRHGVWGFRDWSKRPLYVYYLNIFHVFFSENLAIQSLKSLNKQQKSKSKILTDAFLNIERDGKFPDDNPCPYLGIRKPTERGMYPNEYYNITCKPHRYFCLETFNFGINCPLSLSNRLVSAIMKNGKSKHKRTRNAVAL